MYEAHKNERLKMLIFGLVVAVAGLKQRVSDLERAENRHKPYGPISSGQKKDW